MTIWVELSSFLRIRFFFFFQAEDGIRDYKVTGVQTCALPISCVGLAPARRRLCAAHQSARRRDERRIDRTVVFDRRALAAPDRRGHHLAAAQIGRASCRERV